MQLSDIPIDDHKTFRMLSAGHTVGVFQLESPGMVRLLRSVRPNSLNDISAVLALYRPGPLDNGSHTEYATRKTRRVSGPSLHPELDETLKPILSETHGLIVYQEQVMRIIAALTGWGYGEAEDIFTAMRKKKLDRMEEAKPGFFEAASARGYSKDAISKVWETLIPFSDYSFNKAHSIGYACLAYRGAYLKANHPKQYMAALLSSAKDVSEVSKFIREAQRLGVRVMPPDINESSSNFTITPEGIRYGLSSIKGVGNAATEAIVARRPYGSLNDFFRRADDKVLNAGVLEALGKSGAFDSLWPTREDLVVSVAELARLAAEERKNRRWGQGRLIKASYRPSSSGQNPGQIDRNLRAEWERATLGMQVTFPRVLLQLSRPLDATEWHWVHKLLTAGTPTESVGVRIGRIEIDIPTRTTLNDTLISQLDNLGIRANHC